MKIAVYTIAKNEEKHVKRWVRGASEADYMVVADTGSTDNTVEKLRKNGVRTRKIFLDPFRFDDARNAALALVPKDVDVCISVDMDEIIHPGWRKALENVWKPDTTKAFYQYIWSHTPDGKPEVQFPGDRCHARTGYRWRYPTHEGLYASMRTIETTADATGMTVEQFQDTSKVRPNDLNLLAWGLWENPTSLRMMHYYGRELMWKGYYKEAVEQFMNYLKNDTNKYYPAENEATGQFLAKCLKELHARGELPKTPFAALEPQPNQEPVVVVNGDSGEG